VTCSFSGASLKRITAATARLKQTQVEGGLGALYAELLALLREPLAPWGEPRARLLAREEAGDLPEQFG